jgi:hypothetical protein
VSSLFAAMLGVNPVEHLLSDAHALSSLSAAHRAILTGREFFPRLLSEPFHQGLTVVFLFAAALSVLAGLASLFRGGRTLPSTVTVPDITTTAPTREVAQAAAPAPAREAPEEMTEEAPEEVTEEATRKRTP